MRIALVGHGRMGSILERLLRDKVELEIYNRSNLSALGWSQAEVVIDFSSPTITRQVLEWTLPRGIAVVTGTTGWEEHLAHWVQWAKTLPEVRWVYGSNFSMGIQALWAFLPQWVSYLEAVGWDWALLESHHNQKKDAPSGTAKALADRLLHVSRKKADNQPLSLASLRVGYEIGQHKVIFSGPGESIEITHQVMNREVFARGAIWAAYKLVESSPPLVLSFSELFLRKGIQGTSGAF